MNNISSNILLVGHLEDHIKKVKHLLNMEGYTVIHMAHILEAVSDRLKKGRHCDRWLPCRDWSSAKGRRKIRCPIKYYCLDRMPGKEKRIDFFDRCNRLRHHSDCPGRIALSRQILPIVTPISIIVGFLRRTESCRYGTGRKKPQGKFHRTPWSGACGKNLPLFAETYLRSPYTPWNFSPNGHQPKYTLFNF